MNESYARRYYCTACILHVCEPWTPENAGKLFNRI